jgi:hypothetical protein
MLRCASGPICQRRVLSRSVGLVSRVQRRLRRFHPVGIREAKGVYHHRFHLPGFAVMSVFELQQRNKRVFVQNLELVGQFLERHVSASFRCAIHAHRNRCSKERQETLVHGINRTSFVNQFRARWQKEGRKRESFPPIPLPGHFRGELSFAILLCRSLRSCLAGLAGLVSCGTWLAYFPFPLVSRINRAAIFARDKDAATWSGPSGARNRGLFRVLRKPIRMELLDRSADILRALS